MKKLNIISLVVFIVFSAFNIWGQNKQPLTLSNIKNSLTTFKKAPNVNCKTQEGMNKCLIDALKERGADFIITSQDKLDLKQLGANEELIKMLSLSSSRQLSILALISYNRDDYVEALDFINQAIELYKIGEYYVMRGLLKDESGNPADAINDFYKAIELNFEGANLYTLLGSAFYHNGEYENAIKNLNKSINIDANIEENYYLLGLVYFAQNNYKDSINSYRNAIKLNPKYAKAYYEMGRVYENRQMIDEAINSYNAAIKENYDCPCIYYNLGEIYNFAKKEYKKSIVNYEESIKRGSIGKIPAYAYYKLGWAYHNDKSYDKAIENYKKAIAIEPHVLSYYAIGNAFYDKNNYAEAIVNYKNAIQSDSSFKPAYEKLRNVFYEQGKTDEAKKINVEISKIPSNPENKTSSLNKELYPRKEDFENKEKLRFIYPTSQNRNVSESKSDPLTLNAIENSLKPEVIKKAGSCNTPLKMNECLIDEISKRGTVFIITPEEVLRLKSMGAISELTGLIKQQSALKNAVLAGLAFEKDADKKNYKEVMEFLRLSIELDDSGRYYAVRGDLKEQYEKCNDAISDYEQAIYRNFKSAEIYYKLAGCYYEKKDYDKAIPNYKEAIKIEPNYYRYRDLGLAYHNKGNDENNKDYYDTAITFYNESIRLNPKFALAYNSLGLAYYRKENYAEAIKNYKKSIELDSESYPPYYNFGLVYYKQKNYTLAIEKFSRAIELKPEDPDAYLYRSKCYDAIGEKEKAKTDKKQYEELLKKSKL